MFSGRPGAKWIVLALGALVLLAPSTTSLAVSAVDRPVSAMVADDDDAFLPIEHDDIYLDNGHHKDVPLAIVTNKLGATADVALDILSGQDGPPPIVKHPSGAVQLADDASGELTADITCGNAADKVDDIGVKITATTEDITVTLTRTVTVHCTGDPPKGDDDEDGEDDNDKDDDVGNGEDSEEAEKDGEDKTEDETNGDDANPGDDADAGDDTKDEEDDD